MLNKVVSTIERYEMLEKGKTVIVAVSGGADSMALLSMLSKLKDQYNIRLLAAHVNHCLRGCESDRDEYFVSEFCYKNSIELTVLKSDISALSASSGKGLEECGRRIRYDFFKSLDQNALIATAHTLSDSIETIIFNLARGSALKGLCGIPAVRGAIRRPLIECTRSEVENYCNENKIDYINDSSNTDEQYSRNHIRMNIIPQLRKINPRFQDAFLRCSHILSIDDNLLDNLSAELYETVKAENGYLTDGLLKANPSLRKRVLSKILHEQTGSFADSKHIDALDMLLHTGGRLQVTNGVIYENRNGLLKLYCPVLYNHEWCFDLSAGIFEIENKTIEIEIINKKDLDRIQNIHTNILDNCLDYDKIIGNSFIRNRRAGDEIRLKNRRCTKSIKKMFNEAAVPIQDRNRIVLIADSKGLLWVEAFGVDQRCEITCDTQRILLISVRRTQHA